MSVYEKLKSLDITLAAPAAPVAAYVMHVQSGNKVFLSGHIAKKADGAPWVGQLGKNISTEEGKQAARSIAIAMMGTLQEACGGDLTRVKRIVKVMSLVNSTPTTPNSTWSPTAAPSCWAKCSATPASTPAPPLAWRRSRLAPALKLN